ncbi:sensor histidine kinase [Sulfurospirillum deleyianum]|uniref:histidine kinase n=1 Tax=Sulfurospirillum deleyianum (strain ATCC 51133 / DSM 6946 / 5175) TaxID=525898 RepID=D1B282_SULD5|nr:HAMP domain-containing sensor histidine kinase [Sulfurospirillum deleyianum]ACZ12202.1 ATP-binding region ATPase domain protein [Sulfurospirillum deleyianum DSM 6946]
MNKIPLVFVALFLFVHTAFALDIKNVLIINSYHKGYYWSDTIIDTLQKNLEKENCYLHVLYMDSKRINTENYLDSLTKSYQLQLEKREFDLIVAVDNFAYDFVCKNYEKLRLNQNIYFIGLEKSPSEIAQTYNLLPKTSGLMEKRLIVENIFFIKETLPRIKKIYIVNDESKNGNDTHTFIEEAMMRFKDEIEFKYIRSSSLSELKSLFHAFREDEALFFVRFYNDKEGNLVDNLQLTLFLNECKIPVFVTDNEFIDFVFGGYILHVEKMAHQASIEINNILKSYTFHPQINTYTLFEKVINYKKLESFQKQFTISLSNTTKLINSPENFFDKYKLFINIVFILSPFLLILIIGLIYNIYVRIKKTHLLEQRMEFDKILLESLDHPIVWYNENGFIVESNKNFERFLELSFENSPHIQLKTLIEDNTINVLMKRLFEHTRKNFSALEIDLTCKDNNKKHTFIIKNPEYAQNTYNLKGNVAIFLDITDIRHAMQKQRKQQEFIIQQSKLAEIGEILSSIAHQWKTPLIEISAIVQEYFYVQHRLLEEEHAAYQNDVMTQIKYMTDTIDDFQTFLKPSNEKITFNIQESIEKILSIVDHTIRYNHIEILMDIEENSNLCIYGYKNEFMQSLLNIINNAKEQILKQKEKTKTLKGMIKITIFNQNDYLILTIEDNGGGVSQPNIEDIFNPYVTTKSNGLGIGLYMSKMIIEDKMHGKISVENSRFGAKFTIQLKVCHYENSRA